MSFGVEPYPKPPFWMLQPMPPNSLKKNGIGALGSRRTAVLRRQHSRLERVLPRRPELGRILFVIVGVQNVRVGQPVIPAARIDDRPRGVDRPGDIDDGVLQAARLGSAVSLNGHQPMTAG